MLELFGIAESREPVYKLKAPVETWSHSDHGNWAGRGGLVVKNHRKASNGVDQRHGFGLVCQRCQVSNGTTGSPSWSAASVAPSGLTSTCAAMQRANHQIQARTVLVTTLWRDMMGNRSLGYLTVGQM